MYMYMCMYVYIYIYIHTLNIHTYTNIIDIGPLGFGFRGSGIRARRLRKGPGRPRKVQCYTIIYYTIPYDNILQYNLR